MAAALEVVLRLKDQMSSGFGKASGSVKRFSDNTKSAFKSIATIPNLIAGTAAVAVARSIGNATMQLEAMESRMKAAVITTDNYNESMKFTRDIAQRLGLEIKATTNGFAGFAASALRSDLTMRQTKQIFEDVSVAATSLKLGSAQLGLVFKALEQISGKGKVSMEELRQQLGDSLPGAVSIAAKAMNMTTAAFMDAVKKGEILSSDFLPRFAAQMRKELGGASEEAANSFQANMTRIGNSIFRIQSSFGKIFSKDAAGGAGDLAKLFDGIADSIDRNAGRIRAGVMTILLPIQILVQAFKIAGDTIAALVMYLVNAGVWAFKTFANVVDVTAQSLITLAEVAMSPVKLLDKEFRESIVKTFTGFSGNIAAIVDDTKKMAGEMAGIWNISGSEFDKNIDKIAQSMLGLSQSYNQAGNSISDFNKKAAGSGSIDAGGLSGASSGAATNFSGISIATGFNIQAKINAENEMKKQSDLAFYEWKAEMEQKSIEASIARANQMRDAYQNIASSLQSAFAEAFTIMVDLNTSAADKIKGVMQSMFRYITQMLIQYIARMAALRFAQFLLTGGTGGAPMIGSALMSMFSGRGFANGTQNAPPGWHMVGERGPEMINLRGGESITSNGRSQASMGPVSISTVINGNADSSTVRAISDENEKLARKIEDLVRRGYLPRGAFGV
jgi:tape measure domain-containing protein